MDHHHQNVVSKWFNVQNVPENYRFPPKDRPGKLSSFSTCKSNIPVIDIGRARNRREKQETIHQIMKSSQEFGIFQVINHGVPEDVIAEAVGVLKELFSMPAEVVSSEAKRVGFIYMGSTDFAKDGVHLWRDNIKHSCHPLEESMQHWPEKPPNYRKVMQRYSVEIRRLSLRILELISEGLGIEKGYLEEESVLQFLTANHYPPCPDPSLTLGVLQHCDPSLITILYQGHVNGLQVLNKDNNWIGVEALPNAFAVNIGTQLEIISNGKLRSAPHRAVTNPKETRTTIAVFINPSPNSVVEPAKALVNESNPPVSAPFSYKDFVNSSNAFGPATKGLKIGHLGSE